MKKNDNTKHVDGSRNMNNEKRIIELLNQQNIKLDKILKLLSSVNDIRTINPTKKQTTQNKKPTVAGLIIELKNEKFFDSPKSLSEIAKKLEEKNYVYPITSLTLPLQKLVRGRELGRILKQGKWSYVKR